MNRIRSVNRTEYDNPMISDFLLEQRVKQEFTAAHSPQENGVAEQNIALNWTRALAFLANAGILKTIPESIGEAFIHAVYLNDLRIDGEEENMLLEPILFSVAWIHVEKDDRNKMEP